MASNVVDLDLFWNVDVVLRDTEIKDGKKKKSSHINWWLYENAKPHVYFEVIPDFKTYLEEISKKEV